MDSRTALPVVGMVGGGQLARMTHQAAIALGQSLRIMATQPDDGAALVAPDLHVGAPDDLAALRRFADGCDVVTFDHEHVPGEHIRALAEGGVTVHPSAEALHYAQDKRAMRERLAGLGVPVPRWRPVTGAADVGALAAETGWPVMAKAVRGGYDGRGVWVVNDPSEAAARLQDGLDLLVEERVPLRRELAVQAARSPFGQIAVYPVVETVQERGVCVEVLAPAPDLPDDRSGEIQQLAIRLATELKVVGLLTVELFDTGDQVLVNELAMRPHNSGHWSIEGARTSQFEQHLRAVLDYPLGECTLTAPAVAMANVFGSGSVAGGNARGQALDERLHHLFATDPGVKVHLYGKRDRPGRKVGHVTALGSDPAAVRTRAMRAARLLREGTGP
jgi:5-(carboxyamino)imidazole ribonucleotide synthase